MQTLLALLLLISTYSAEYDVPYAVMVRMANQESGFDVTLEHPFSGCLGLFQVNPAAWAGARYGFAQRSDYFDPAKNARFAAWYMRWMLDTQFDGDLRKAVAGFNGGHNYIAGLVERYGDEWEAHLTGDPKRYVGIVLGSSQGEAWEPSDYDPQRLPLAIEELLRPRRIEEGDGEQTRVFEERGQAYGGGCAGKGRTASAGRDADGVDSCDIPRPPAHVRYGRPAPHHQFGGRARGWARLHGGSERWRAYPCLLSSVPGGLLEQPSNA